VFGAAMSAAPVHPEVERQLAELREAHAFARGRTADTRHALARSLHGWHPDGAFALTGRRRMIQESRGAGRRLRAMLLSVGCLLAVGCSEETWWDARGSWSGTVTVPGEAAVQGSSNLSDPVAGQNRKRIRLCELSTIVLGMTFVPIERDRPAAIEVRTARPLCHEGRTQITGGEVLIWANPGSDPNVLGAIRSSGWTVTGEIEITSYRSEGLPRLNVGEEANTERIEGSLSLTATDGAGSVIRIDGATFDLTVVASRVKLTIS
jgi:hypothetical protein